MQHLPQGVKDIEGCFVYQYIGGDKNVPIAVRSTLGVGTPSQTEQVIHHKPQNKQKLFNNVEQTSFGICCICFIFIVPVRTNNGCRMLRLL